MDDAQLLVCELNQLSDIVIDKGNFISYINDE